MTIRAPHLQDDCLYDCYFVARRGEPLDPPAAEHLTDCVACRERYSALGEFLTSLSVRAEHDIDALFPPERLRLQQQEIARRLEHIGHVARVLTFPGHVAAGPMHAPGARTATRWIAASAAACLLIGIFAGRMYEQGWLTGATPHRVVAAHQAIATGRSARLAPIATDGKSAPAVDADEYFMSDLETALDRPRTRELMPFDALTPHVREIRDIR